MTCVRCNGRGTLGGATQSAIFEPWTCPECDGLGRQVRTCAMWSMDHCICPSLRECVRWAKHDAAEADSTDNDDPIESLKAWVARLQAEIVAIRRVNTWCESKHCKRTAVGYAEDADGMRWLACAEHGGRAATCDHPNEHLSGCLCATWGSTPGLGDARDTVTTCIVILGGLTEVWEPLPYDERCARAENELRHLLDRLGGAS